MSTPAPHSLLDDAQGFLAGAFCLGLAMALFQSHGLLTGGTAGLTLLIVYLTELPAGAVFWLLNLPFFLLGWWRLGSRFTIKSLIAISLIGLVIEATPRWVRFAEIDPLYAAAMGGLLGGFGAIAFIRHGASIGGISILTLYLQQSRGWRAGYVQLAVDGLILAAALVQFEPSRVAASVLGAAVMNLVLAVNHRPGRYLGY